MEKINFNYEKKVWGWEKPGISFFDPHLFSFQYLVSEIKKIRDSKNKIKILDIACGGGGMAKSLKRKFPNFDFYGCDISKIAIAEAKNKTNDVKFIVSNAQNLPFKNKEFDLVYMNSVLDHLEKPNLAVKEASRVLKNGGVFLSLTPLEASLFNLHGFFSYFKSFRSHRLKYLGHIHAFNKKSLKKLIENEGFKIENNVFDWLYFAQLVDITYYFLTAFLKKRPGVSIDGYIKQNESFNGNFVKSIRSIFTFMQNIESFFALRLPFGYFSYVRAIKK